MACRPQANGPAGRMVQAITRALKMYVQDRDQKDWDEYAERLTFAINTAQDRIRGDTPFYLVHGWDPRSTLEASIPVDSTKRRDRDPRRWRYQIQRHYQQARSQIQAGSQVWLYLDRVKGGYTRKLAHRWHGPFRVADKIGEHAVRLEAGGTEYRLFPVVHVSKLKLVKEYPDRPRARITDEFEIEKITDMRSGKRTRYDQIYREFPVHWRGYEDPSWVDEADLNCGALLHEFLRERANHNRFDAMQSHEE
ncbi:hypothetical protein C6341_g4133 [Phytophthora cactorum]|nr:hypothetical protein C6341_g4133 [Phytophthora cactorum]